MMRILYVSQFFYPEVGATTNRALANVRHLAKKHQVTVLTEMPNHPQGIIFEGYQNKLFMTEKMEDFTVKRVWVRTSPKKVFYTRLLFYFSFALLAAAHTLMTAKKYDVLYISSPPLFVSFTGIFCKILFPKKKIVFEVRDLWPDSAVEMGELSNKIFRNLSYRLEKSIYKKADKIITVTDYIRNAVVKKLNKIDHQAGNDDKVLTVFNGAEPQIAAKKIDSRIPLIESLKKEGKFVVIYAGLLGLAQNIGVLIRASSLLTDQDIHFLIVGSGPLEKELKNQAQGLANVTFTGEVPRQQIHNYLMSADCGVIPLADLPVFRGAIPSKFFEYMVFRLPILLGLQGEAEKLLQKAEAGIAYQPDDPDDLAQKIKFLKDNPDFRKRCSAKGRDFVLNYFNRDKQAEIIEKMLRVLVR